MVKRVRKYKESGAAFKKLLQEKGFSQYKLGQVTGIDISVISKIVNGYTAEPKLETLEKIATALDVEIVQLTNIFTASNTNSSESPTNPQPQELASTVSKYKDPDFLGREKDIENLNNLVNQGAKVILIKAEGGIGKTKLAEKWFEIQGLDYLKLNVGTTSQNLNSVEEWVRLKLKDTFKVNPANNFITMLEQLQTELQEKPIGIFIDNLEPALQNGEFIETQKNYIDLLLMLAEKKVNCITIITSREQIYDGKIFSLLKIHNLEGLNQETWQEYFENKGIKIDDDSLNSMWQNYGGNAEAMYILSGDILKESQGDLKVYWQNNSEDLLRHRSLEQLVQSQFDKLRNDNLQAYNLLCRLGVYPNQNIDLPKVWLFCLLWDVPENRRNRVIDNLVSRCLVKKRDEGYYLHPMIQTESKSRLHKDNSQKYINELLFLIKKEIDIILYKYRELQYLLSWINKKASKIYIPCIQSEIRSFYFILITEFLYTPFKGLGNLYKPLNKNAISKDFNNQLMNTSIDEIELDLNLIISLWCGVNFDGMLYQCLVFWEMDEETYEECGGFYLTDLLEIALYLGRAFTYAHDINPQLETALQELQNQILDSMPDLENSVYEEWKQYREWWKNYSNIWIEQLKKLMMKYRNLNLEDWKFTKTQRELIQQYYNANKLLVDCLNYASPEVRSYIEDTLLLPIEEIEKRPFKN